MQEVDPLKDNLVLIDVRKIPLRRVAVKGAVERSPARFIARQPCAARKRRDMQHMAGVRVSFLIIDVISQIDVRMPGQPYHVFVTAYQVKEPPIVPKVFSVIIIQADTPPIGRLMVVISGSEAVDRRVLDQKYPASFLREAFCHLLRPVHLLVGEVVDQGRVNAVFEG